MIIVGAPQVIIFKYSDRKRVVNKFEQWVKYHPVSNCPETFISWMFNMGYLRLDKIKEDLELDDEIEPLE